MSTTASSEVRVAGPSEAPEFATWCRGCGSRMLVGRDERRPDYCGLGCRIKHRWRTATWRSF